MFTRKAVGLILEPAVLSPPGQVLPGQHAPNTLRGRAEVARLQDIFVSYAREDHAPAEAIAASLRDAGFSVWIDTTGILEGRAYDLQIEMALRDAKAVVVLWSHPAVASEWVRSEASEAHRRGKLIPLLMDDAEPPLQFRNVQSIDFRGWDGSPQGRPIQNLKAAVERRLAGNSTTRPSAEPGERPVPSWRKVLDKGAIAFADADQERRFGEFFTERFLPASRMYLVLIAALYGAFAVTDYISASTNGQSNPVYLVATPVIVAGFLLSLWPPLLAWWRPFSLVYGALATILVLWGFMRLGHTIARPIDYRDVILVLVPMVVFIGSIPLRLPESALLAAGPVATGPYFLVEFGGANPDVAMGMQIIIGTYAMMLISAWWREHNTRQWFLETRRHSALR
jgi:hypothetical protein